MLRNYFKLIIRSLVKNKIYSTLNILGLAIGITCAGLIFLWVQDERSFDGFNVNRDRLYFARVNSVLNTSVFTHGSTPGIMGPAIQQQIPGIENTCRMTESTQKLLFSIGQKSLYAGGRYAEPSLFSMFTLPFVQGNSANAFSQPYSMVITEKTAKKFFGDEKEIVGRTVRVDNKTDYTITGVLKDIPDYSSLQFEWVAPFEVWFKQSPWAYQWENNCLSTYVELKPGASLAAVNGQLYNFVQKHAPESTGHVFLFPMSQWRLYNDFENGKQTGGGRITYVRMFSLIAWIILLIACINFMNLATARSEKRAREVGVRKVLGAGKKRLVGQFIGEALFMAALSSLVAIILISLTLPVFNLLVQKNMEIGLNNPSHILALLIITLVTGIIAGTYPSFYLSSFNPVFVLKGIRIKSTGSGFVRKGLVILQFAISIILIICTVIIYQQIQHVKSRDLGFDKQNLLSVDLTGNMTSAYAVMKQELINTGMVDNTALADHATIYGGNNDDGFVWKSKPPGARILISWRDVSSDYLNTSGMKIMEGRDFRITDTLDFDHPPKTVNVIITESLARQMGQGSALGKTITDANQRMIAVVVGVVKDYVYGYVYGKPDPVIFFCTAPRFETTMYVRIRPGSNMEEALSVIGAVVKKNNPAYPFTYDFVDDQFNSMFSSETLVSKLSRVFASLAIFISCLGLFGLAAYTAERRTKEIGIRKVLGASASGVVRLLSTDFLQLVLLSCIIAFPIAWWFMNGWLQGYPYRITIGWWVFFAAGFSALSIALLTVSFQAVKAAIANPVKSLRSE
ncbi:MAG TPA: ABC transporter permease [Puia sp.]|nr:ABC transporter permease [Puia sp.]